MTIHAFLEKTIAAIMLMTMAAPNTAVTTAPAVTNASLETAVETPVEPNASQELTVQDVTLAVCASRGYDESCAKTLLGMVWVESNNISTAVGDQGRARGYYQIWYKLHDLPISCAEDLVCSSDWTISYLERNHYPTYVNYAVQCHNSCNAGNGYDARVARHGERLWSEPMPVVQEAPIVLPTMIAMQ